MPDFAIPRARVRRAIEGALRLGWAHAGLLLVLAVALAERLALLRWWKAFPGGDTYNFILIAQELLRGSYPVAEKRLPVYPLLLLPARIVTDWETAAVAVAVVASLAAIALLYALGRALGLSKTSLVVALLPFQAVAPFLFQSIRGYADTTFVALMLGSILMFLRAKTPQGNFLTGALAGAATLTRPEGITLVPALALVQLFRAPRRLGALLLGAVIVGLPFVLLSARAGRSLAPQEYLRDAEATTFGVTTPRAFGTNYWQLWASVGIDRLWGEPLRLLRDLPVLRPSTVILRAWAFFTDPKEFPSFLLLAGFLFLFARRTRPFLFLLLVFIALAAPIAWWGVRQRFLGPLYPLVSLGIAAGAHVLLRGLARAARGSPWQRTLTATGALGLSALALGPWRAHTAAETSEVNIKNWGRDYAYYQAIREARSLPGRIAFDHRSSIALALFGEPDRGRAVFADSHLQAESADTQWRALQEWNVAYLVAHDEVRSAFPVLEDDTFRGRFTPVRTFAHPQTRGGTDRATIYAVGE